MGSWAESLGALGEVARQRLNSAPVRRPPQTLVPSSKDAIGAWHKLRRCEMQ